MANRNMFTDVAGNQPGLSLVSCCLTFAADAQTNGCAVTLSNGFVSSIARTAEGIWQITFADRWKRCLGMLCPPVLPADWACNITAQSLNDSTPTIDLTFQTAASGTDKDPDSLVLYCTFLMKNSSTAEGA